MANPSAEGLNVFQSHPTKLPWEFPEQRRGQIACANPTSIPQPIEFG
jgi:hypothetical protein